LQNWLLNFTEDKQIVKGPMRFLCNCQQIYIDPDPIPNKSSKVKAAMRNNEQALCQLSKPCKTKEGKRLKQPIDLRGKNNL